jgi:hypothetical protein
MRLLLSTNFDEILPFLSDIYDDANDYADEYLKDILNFYNIGEEGSLLTILKVISNSQIIGFVGIKQGSQLDYCTVLFFPKVKNKTLKQIFKQTLDKLGLDRIIVSTNTKVNTKKLNLTELISDNEFKYYITNEGYRWE